LGGRCRRTWAAAIAWISSLLLPDQTRTTDGWNHNTNTSSKVAEEEGGPRASDRFGPTLSRARVEYSGGPGEMTPKRRERRGRAPVKAYTQQGESPCQTERSPVCSRRLLRRGNTGWEAAGDEQPVRNDMTCKDMTERKSDSARPIGEPATAVRSLDPNPRGRTSLCVPLATGSTGLPLRSEINRERKQMTDGETVGWLGTERLEEWTR